MKALPKNFKSINIIVALFIYHLGISILAYIFVKIKSGDALAYWFIIKDASDFMRHRPLPLRENLLFYLNYFFSTYLNLPFCIGFLLYSLIGFIGIYYCFLTIIKLQSPRKFYFLPFLILLLPSMHFWTSIIGKEPICFFGISLVFYSLILRKNSLSKLILGISLLALMRPHVAIILSFSILLAYMVKNRRIKFIPILIFIAFTGASLYLLLRSHWLQGLSIVDFQNLFKVHHVAFRKTDTYVPLEEYNFIYKIFTFYFRPLPFEYNSILGLLTGMENIFSLSITIAGIFSLVSIIGKYNYRLDILEISIIFFFILLATVLTLAYSNFGLISRMKNQSLPFILMLCIHWIRLYLNKNYEQT